MHYSFYRNFVWGKNHKRGWWLIRMKSSNSGGGRKLWKCPAFLPGFLRLWGLAVVQRCSCRLLLAPQWLWRNLGLPPLSLNSLLAARLSGQSAASSPKAEVFMVKSLRWQRKWMELDMLGSLLPLPFKTHSLWDEIGRFTKGNKSWLSSSLRWCGQGRFWSLWAVCRSLWDGNFVAPILPFLFLLFLPLCLL